MSMLFGKSVFLFALAAVVVRPAIAADSLVVSPKKPTTSDSIKFSIFIKNWNCCAQYIHDSTAVVLLDDSTIALNFTVSQLAICPAIACIPTLAPVLIYKRGHLPTGSYSVYEGISQSCTGGIMCKDTVMLTLIGKFTVSEPTITFNQKKSMPLENIGKMSVNERLYDIRGAIMSSNLSGASKRTSGVYFVKPDDRAAVKMKIWY